MNRSPIIIQDIFLNYARKETINVTLTLLTGEVLTGLVKGFDSFVIMLENGPTQTLVYKHSIATIRPEKPFYFSNNNNGDR